MIHKKYLSVDILYSLALSFIHEMFLNFIFCNRYFKLYIQILLPIGKNCRFQKMLTGNN